mmetsp:Transcript_23260/g.74252  ORF Transcript_23260/g.74252 Transcript_23260/m.74252 type:complete len:232 (-) Transcript_23260:367-1062(-)
MRVMLLHEVLEAGSAGTTWRRGEPAVVVKVGFGALGDAVGAASVRRLGGHNSGDDIVEHNHDGPQGPDWNREKEDLHGPHNLATERKSLPTVGDHEERAVDHSEENSERDPNNNLQRRAADPVDLPHAPSLALRGVIVKVGDARQKLDELTLCIAVNDNDENVERKGDVDDELQDSGDKARDEKRSVQHFGQVHNATTVVKVAEHHARDSTRRGHYFDPHDGDVEAAGRAE